MKFRLAILLLPQLAMLPPLFSQDRYAYGGSATVAVIYSACVGKSYLTCDTSIFEDYEHMNFQLKKNADLFKTLPEFKSISFETIRIRK
jgi:hypothetical protein